MLDDLIYQAAKLMQEQAAAYARLDASCAQLSASLVRGAPAVIESLTRAGESEMLRMRGRLVQIMNTLTAFADARAAVSDGNPLSVEARAAFETASNNLLQAARKFQQTRGQAAALATSGATFATACIEMCGVKPTTYRAPYAQRGETRPWA